MADDVVINPALAKLSSGDLPLPATEGDQILMLAYNVEEQEAEYNLVGQTRKTGSDKLELDEPGTYHLYAAFISYDRSRQSDSVYLGSVVI